MKKYHLENYRKFLLNRVTASSRINEYIDHSLASEDEAAHHSFHKLMVHNWSGTESELFDILSEYFSCTFIPVNCSSQGDILTFYTSSLKLVSKIVKLDFMFPHQRNMYNIDILFNDKTSADCFDNRITIENIVTGVVSSRLNERCVLNLTKFCEDPEFVEKKIHFYKINLLASFKILMLRMGRDTSILNLSNNNLSQVPVEILNFFIKGDLTAVNLSNNNIPSIAELHRMSSKIEKLWVEGNPLCYDVDAMTYVKQITMKFPRLCELDGVKLNEHVNLMPFLKNYLEPPDKKTKMVVEKFLCLYFSHYDASRKNVGMFYHPKAELTLSTDIADKQGEPYTNRSRNFYGSNNAALQNKRVNTGRHTIVDNVLVHLPESIHDPTTLTVDVLKHDKKQLIIVVDGIFKEKNKQEKVFQFRRTFVFSVVAVSHVLSEYFIINELFSLRIASNEQVTNNLKNAKSTNPYALRDPDPEDVDAICNIFMYLTHLKQPEAELRLKIHGWDIKKSLQEFIQHFKSNKIATDRFIDEDDFSDTSSLVEELME